VSESVHIEFCLKPQCHSFIDCTGARQISTVRNQRAAKVLVVMRPNALREEMELKRCNERHQEAMPLEVR
jgi:hypothetical protein